MTKENREKAYKHFRDLEANYTALPHLDSGITATVRIREESKKSANALLKRNPELAELDIEKINGQLVKNGYNLESGAGGKVGTKNKKKSKEE